LAPGICGALIGLNSTLIALGSATYIISSDPVDHDYEREDLVTFGKLPVPDGVNPRRLRRAFRDVFNNAIQIVAYTEAAYTASNRYEGALEREHVYWIDYHFAMADEYLRQAGYYLNLQEGALATLIGELNRAGIIIDAAPGGDFGALWQFAWWLRNWPNYPSVGGGIDPNPVRNALRELGFSAEEVDNMTALVATARVDYYYPVVFPDVLWNITSGMAEMGWVFQQ
jgi:hypothetical protein